MFLRRPVKVSVWARGDDKRLYFDPLGGRAYGTEPLALYAVTGSDRHKPKTAYGMPARIKDDPALKKEFFAICAEMAQEPSGTCLSCSVLSDGAKKRLADRQELARREALDEYRAGLSAWANFEFNGHSHRLVIAYTDHGRKLRKTERVDIERLEEDGSFRRIASAERSLLSTKTYHWKITPYAFVAADPEFALLTQLLQPALDKMEETHG